MLSTAVESSFVLKVADSPVESSGVQFCVEYGSGVQSSPVLCRMQLTVQWSPVESRFVLSTAVESSGVQFCVKSS